MDGKINEFYERYRRGSMDRRGFLRELAAMVGGASAAAAILGILESSSAYAAFVAPDDGRLETGYVKYAGADCEMRAYSAQPKGEEKLAGVIVIHENRGLQPQIEDVARRVALEGYHAIAPDALSPLGGTPEDMDKVRAMFGELDREQTVKNFVAAVKYLKTGPKATGKVGCMGFCWGGGMTNQVAVNAPTLTAAVPFYGAQPSAEDVPKIKAAMLCHYAGEDRRINAGIEAFEEAMKKAKIEYKICMYEGAQHAFFNDSNEARYNKEAAELAWKRTVAFFNEKLKKKEGEGGSA